MINIPNQEARVWQQPNVSDLFGNLFVTKNLTFDSKGYLGLSFSPRAVITEATANFDNVSNIIHNGDYDYFISVWGEAPWSVDDSPLSTAPSQIATAGVPTTDLETGVDYFGALMVVSQDTDVDYYNTSANSWTDTNITLTNNGQHAVVNMLSLNALAIADVNTVRLYANPITATPSLITTLTIPTDFEITQLVYLNQNLYIGTQNVVGGKAAMYVWNGQGTAAQQAYQVNSNIIFSLAAHKGAIFALLGNGALEKFNGGNFDFAAGFPIYYTDMVLTDYANISLYKDIMRSNDFVLFINFTNQENNSNSLTFQPDGIWCYDENVGLYHRYSNTIRTPFWDTINTTDVNTTTNQITVATAPVSGTEVYYNDGGSTPIGGLTDQTKYYVIKIDATHVQLAENYTDSVASPAVPIDLTGTGNVFQELIFFPNTDYGQFYAGRPTATLTIDIPSPERQYGTELLWGTEVIRRDNTGNYGTLMTASSELSSRGYMITPKIYSKDVTNNYDLLTLKFLPFTSDLDKIIIKTRTVDDMRNIIDLSGTNWSITWTSTTTFTVTAPFDEWALAVVGDEVEILTGAGGGLLAHITAISEAGGTYTVTLDESYPDYVTGDIGKAVFRNWKKFKTIVFGDSNANQKFLSAHLGLKGPFLQLKIELRGVNQKIVELEVDDVFRLPAKDK